MFSSISSLKTNLSFKAFMMSDFNKKKENEGKVTLREESKPGYPLAVRPEFIANGSSGPHEVPGQWAFGDTRKPLTPKQKEAVDQLHRKFDAKRKGIDFDEVPVNIHDGDSDGGTKLSPVLYMKFYAKYTNKSNATYLDLPAQQVDDDVKISGFDIIS